MKSPKFNRRNFLRNTSLGFLGAGLVGKKGFATPSQEQDDELPKIKEYRTLGRTGFKVSDIGTGIILSENLLKPVFDSGVNYIDTAQIYDVSNACLGVLTGMVQTANAKKFFITTKVWPHPPDNCESTEEVLQKVKNSLGRLKTDYIDCLMIHEAASSKLVKDEYFHSAMDQLKSEGKVKHIGIACHGHNWRTPESETESMEQIFGTAIDDGRFDVFLLVYNFANQDMGKRILNSCKEKNIGTTIMKSNPIKRYAEAKKTLQNPEDKNESQINFAKKYMDFSDQMLAYFEENNLKSNDDTFRDLAIPFVLSNPHVNTVIYSFRNFSDVDTVVSLSGKKLSLKDQAFLENVVKEYGELHCRIGCNICESKCPHRVPVNTIMRYNYYFTLKGEEKSAMLQYNDLPGGKPDLCVDCEGFCEKACPYGVLTRPLLAMAHQNLSFENTV